MNWAIDFLVGYQREIYLKDRERTHRNKIVKRHFNYFCHTLYLIVGICARSAENILSSFIF